MPIVAFELPTQGVKVTPEDFDSLQAMDSRQAAEFLSEKAKLNKAPFSFGVNSRGWLILILPPIFQVAVGKGFVRIPDKFVEQAEKSLGPMVPMLKAKIPLSDGSCREAGVWVPYNRMQALESSLSEGNSVNA